jgi:O-antigen/teichoic acid export membrane protein
MQISRVRISQNALSKLASELVGRLAVFALVLFAARQLGEAGFGLVNYALALGFVVAQLADLGLQMVVSREIAAGRHDPTTLVTRALQIKLVLSAVVVFGLWLVALRSTAPARGSLLALSLVPLFQTYLEFVAYVYRGRQQVRVEARLLAAGRLAAAAAGAAVLVLGYGLAGLAASQLTVAVAFAFAGLVMLRREGWLDGLRQSLAVWQIAGDRPPTVFLLTQAIPLGIAIFLSIAYTRLAVLMLGQMTSAATVAHYSAATRLVEPAQLIPASLMAAVFPAFTLALWQDRQAAGALGRRVAWLLAGAGVALAAGLWLAAPWLIPWLYGPEYAESVRVLQVSALAIPLTFVNYSLTHYLIARGQQGLMVVFTGLMLALHAALSRRLIPILGPTGPAWSILASEAVLLACCLLTLGLSTPRAGASAAASQTPVRSSTTSV